MNVQDTIRDQVHDIAGVRVVCSFVTDVYRVFDLLTSQQDVTLLQVKDYIREPKANGYQSLHAIVQIPVFVSTGPEAVTVEIQFRTIAMDFWASLEHKIYYKYNRAVPAELLRELKDAADTATSLDQRMERLRDEIHSIRSRESAERPPEASEHALRLLQRAIREIQA